MIKRLLATAFLLAAVSASPAQAQDGSESAATRTPAGAQRFLARAMEQGVIIWVYSPHGGGRGNWHGPHFGLSAPLSWIAEGDCITRIEAPNASIEVLDPNSPAWASLKIAAPENAERVDAFFAQSGLPRPPFRIDWSKITDLVRTGVSCPACGAQEPRFFRFQNFYIWVPTTALADRMEFALKFLVERCGLPEVEGF